MTSHLAALLLFSLLVSIVFATLLRDDTTSRIRFAVMAFSTFVLSAFVVGWLMSPFPP